MYNRVRQAVAVNDSTGSWSGGGSSYGNLKSSTGNRINMVRGLDEDGVQANFVINATVTSGGTSGFGIKLDASTVPAAGNEVQSYVSSGATGVYTFHSQYFGNPGLGVHYLQAVEAGDGVNTNTRLGGSYMLFGASVMQ
jgi:hypothetical protein